MDKPPLLLPEWEACRELLRADEPLAITHNVTQQKLSYSDHWSGRAALQQQLQLPLSDMRELQCAPVDNTNNSGSDSCKQQEALNLREKKRRAQKTSREKLQVEGRPVLFGTCCRGFSRKLLADSRPSDRKLKTE